MAQDNDLRLRYGTWEQYLNGRWNEASDATQQWLSERYSGVRGTGDAQSFENIGYPETTTNRYTSRDAFLTSWRAAKERGVFAGPRDKSQKKNFRERFLEAWATWSDEPWPPYIDGQAEFGLDGRVVGPFMEYFEALDADNREPQSFTLDNDEVYTILPGGKVIKEGTKDPETGELIKTPGSSEVFVAEDGRSYIRQPDGTTELVPGEGKIEWNQRLGRTFIRQPDGSVQFGPDPRIDAKIKTDPTGRRYVTQPDGSIQFLDREFDPGVIQEEGYDLLQQPSGALSQLAPLPEEAGVETIGGIQFIKTTSGELVPLDNVLKKMKANMVVTGDYTGAAAVHAWETRPSNQEYFDRMLQYVNAPADQLLVSAIARGQGLVSPPPEETIQRIGPPPEYLTEAFNMLRDQMRMGLPEGTKSFAESMAEQAAELQNESLALDNAAKQQTIETNAVVASDAHEAAVVALQGSSDTVDFSAANSEMDLNLRLNPPDDDDYDAPVVREGQLFSEYEGVQTAQGKEHSELYNEWMAKNPGKADVIHASLRELTLDEAIDWMKNQLEEVEVAAPTPVTGGQVISPTPQAYVSEEAEEQVISLAPQTYVSEEAGEQVDPLTFEEAVQSLQAEGSAGTVFAQPETEPLTPQQYVSEETITPEPEPMMTTQEALASFGVSGSQIGSYAGVNEPSPAMSTDVWDTSNEDDLFAGGGIYDDNTAIVGESGPELAIFPRGTEIVPLDRRMRPSQARRLRNRGVRGMAEGGIVFDNPLDNPLPLGIRQLQAGRSLGAPRGQLLRTAGIALPSAQARRRMLPSEREAFAGLGRMAGIPAGEFQQELGITTPSGAPRTGSARMLPLSLRR
jgi:hypothetical protein